MIQLLHFSTEHIDHKPIEAVYCFPIEEQAAIYSFIARIDDREIVAQLKEKKKAQQEYTDALRQGHGAYLLEQDEKSQDNFIINIGALSSGKECHISISYVSELDLVQNGSKIRFVVPTTIAPRYNRNIGGISSPAGTTSKYVQTALYTIEFHCQVEKVNVSHISSSSHPIQIDVSQENLYIIEFAQSNTHLDRDILIDIELIDNHSNTIVAIEQGAVMVSFTPTKQDCQRAMNKTETKNEFIFVVDCSGSMGDENKIGLARKAILLFLKTLFTEITSIYNEENAQKAEQLINNLQANLGGTELLYPLQWLEQHSPEQGRARQIFLLTDGEISNVNEVIDLCRLMVRHTRIFSFGLGYSPSRSLVKGLARATNGHFVFIPPKSSVDVYVGEQLQKALQSSITDIHVKWNFDTTIMSAPTKMPPVYANDRLIAYALVKDPKFVLNHNSNVELYTDQCQLGKANIDSIPKMANDGTIARLAVKALILELQHSKLKQNDTGSLQSRFKQFLSSLTSKTLTDETEMKKKRIIDLSVKYKILSPHTAFIGVEKRINGSNVGMVLREIPIEISIDDQHLQTSAFGNFGNNAMPTASTPRCKTSIPIQMATVNDSFQICNRDECITLICASEVPFARNRYPSMDLLNISPKMNTSTNEKDEELPKDDENIVRYLIKKQKFNGLWDLTTDNVEKFIGKSLLNFSSNVNEEMLITAIIIVILETRYITFSTMWYGLVEKARKGLLDLLDNDTKQLESLLENIRQQF
ncbi:unnamed protein product [Rotaria sp. Silwood1]|nr:unnamed protein product [Rotaria sp. Silwood1]